MKAWWIGVNLLQRLGRERTTLFATLGLPLLLILVLGVLYGEQESKVGLVDEDGGPLAVELAAAIGAADGVEVTYDPDQETLLDAVLHNDRAAGIVIPAGYDAGLRAGEPVAIEYLATSARTEFGVGGVIQAEITSQAARVAAAHLAGDTAGTSFEEGLGLAGDLAAELEAIDVQVVGPADRELVVLGDFDDTTVRMLLLFVFLIALAASADLIKSRDLGMTRRMLGTPTSAGTIIGGETAGRVLLAVVQSLVIAVTAAVVFGVDWRNWPATLAVLLVFALAAAGGGMLLGALFRRATLADSVGSFIALGMALIGGAMMPFDALAPVPHAFATEAFDKILLQGAGPSGIMAELGALLLYAAALLALAAVALRRSITRA